MQIVHLINSIHKNIFFKLSLLIIFILSLVYAGIQAAAFIYFKTGEYYNSVGHYDMAIRCLNNSIQLTPHNHYRILVRGVVYDNNCQYIEAIDDFTKVISLKPDSTYAFNHRAGAYYHTQQYEKAVADYNSLLIIKPDIPYYLFERGKAHSASGQNGKAVKDYSKILSLEPKDKKAYMYRALAFMGLSEYKKAVRDFDELIKLEAWNIHDIYVFRYIASKKGKIDEGGVLKQSADNRKNGLIFSVIDLYLGNLSPEEYLAKEFKLTPKISSYAELECKKYYYIGEYYFLKNSMDKAKNYFEKSFRTKAFEIKEYKLAEYSLKATISLLEEKQGQNNNTTENKNFGTDA